MNAKIKTTILVFMVMSVRSRRALLHNTNTTYRMNYLTTSHLCIMNLISRKSHVQLQNWVSNCFVCAVRASWDGSERRVFQRTWRGRIRSCSGTFIRSTTGIKSKAHLFISLSSCQMFYQLELQTKPKAGCDGIWEINIYFEKPHAFIAHI